MRHLLLLLVCLAPFICPAWVRADGKVFMRLAEDPASATMPDQQALIHFKDGVETLVIETRFIGKAENFAWVVPLPSVPEVTPATPGLFKTLRAMHQPRIEARTNGSGAILWVLVSLILFIVLAKPTWLLRIVFYIALLLAVGMLLMPSLGEARGSASAPTTDVIEHSRQLVGDFEVSVVESTNPVALTSWLEQHEFNVSPAARRVIADYVADGWVFAAAKMHRQGAAPTGPVTPHPLVFKFPVKSPIYPMRLTGVENNGPLTVDLYVLADHRAKAPGFTVDRCGEVKYRLPEETSRRFGHLPDIVIKHSWLFEQLPAVKVSTRLTGTLPPESMTRDVAIQLVPFQLTQRVLLTPAAAISRASNVAAATFAGGMLILVIVTTVKKWTPRVRIVRFAPIVAVAFGAYFGTYHANEITTGVRLNGWSPIEQFRSDLVQACDGIAQSGKPLDAAKIRELAHILAHSISVEEEDAAVMPIEEDSPGNYVLREKDGKWFIAWYDYFGGETIEPLTYD